MNLRKYKEDYALTTQIAKDVKALGGTAYLVGGIVRDKLLGIQNDDIDIEVHGIMPEQLKEILQKYGELKTIGNSFGIYNLNGYDIDIAMPRKETANGRGGHKDFEVLVDPFCGVEEAAKRRDFTINSIYMDILTGEYIDPYNGILDLKNGIIRATNKDTFIEDPLRVLRAARFASRFNFSIAPETIELCSTMDLSKLPKERVMEELIKLFGNSINGRKSVFFDTLYACNQTEWFKEIYLLKDIQQNTKYHAEGNVYNHTMLVLDGISPKELRYYSFSDKDSVILHLAVLCHDLGKIRASQMDENGIWHNYGHEAFTYDAENLLNRLTTDKEIQKKVLFLCKNHMSPVRLAKHNSNLTKTNTLFDECEKISPNFGNLLICLSLDDFNGREFLNTADFLTKEEQLYHLEEWLNDRYSHYLEYVSSHSEICGQDLINLGLEPGEIFTEILKKAHHLYLAEVPKEHILKQIDIPVLKKALKEQAKSKDEYEIE